MVTENEPALVVPREPGPADSMHWEVGSQDNDRERLANQVGFESWNDLCRYNWNTQAPFEVNWYLRHHVGCSQASADNSTYVFSDQSPRQWMYVRGQCAQAPTHPASRGGTRQAPETRASRGVRQSDTESTVTRRCASIDDYIAAVVKAERIFRGERNCWELITALRRSWAGGVYSTAKWALALPAQYWWAGPLDLSRTRGGDRFSDRDRRVIRGIDCLITRQHGCIDFGHVLTGVNASCWAVSCPYLHTRGLNTPARVVGATTWSGDVGSVYSNYYPYRHNSQARLDDAWQALASDEDLLSDVDGVVLGDMIRSDAGRRPFSQVLQTYYGSSPIAQTRIFTRFAELHPTNRAEEMIWACVTAAAVPGLTPTRDNSILRQLVDRWRNYVSQRQRAAVLNTCEAKRRRDATVVWPPPQPAARRAGGVAADAGVPSDAGAGP